MTDQRYLADSLAREFEATVTRVLDDRVVLDATHFYPEGGGQPADHGALTADGETWDVVDVQKKDTIYHTLDLAEDQDPPAPETTVVGRLDWDRRASHMRYHTAQHLLSALLLDEYDAETSGNQLYTDHAHLDCKYDRFHTDELEHVERRLNDLVGDARPVAWYVMDRDEAEERLDPERTRLALLPDSITEIRIVEIGEPAADLVAAGHAADEAEARGLGGERDGPLPGGAYDRTACAGTHVTNTEQIGEVTVTGRETKGAEEERIEFEIAADAPVPVGGDDA